jgi:hypothetical protein
MASTPAVFSSGTYDSTAWVSSGRRAREISSTRLGVLAFTNSHSQGASFGR